jgi:hypothetical protein
LLSPAILCIQWMDGSSDSLQTLDGWSEFGRECGPVHDQATAHRSNEGGTDREKKNTRLDTKKMTQKKD